MSEIRIGISGWTYPKWRKTFYPPGLAIKQEFAYATSHFSTIEVNGTFYHLQRPSTFRTWYEQAPKHIKFSIKGNQYITHSKRLKDVRAPLANFFASGVLELREKLGPILWQFPPNMKYDAGRFRDFLGLLPHTPRAASALARESTMDFEPVKAHAKAKLRHAVEIRNDSFKTPEFIDLLRAHDVAYVIADTADRWVYAEDLTADFVYIRLHGFKELYTGGYPPEAITLWAKRVRAWMSGQPGPKPQTIAPPPRTARGSKKDVFVYFDNDAKVNAPFDATALTLKLKDCKELAWPSDDPAELMRRKREVDPKVFTDLQARAQNR